MSCLLYKNVLIYVKKNYINAAAGDILILPFKGINNKVIGSSDCEAPLFNTVVHAL